jgi:CheY-like chemotaxis protein
MNLVSPSLLITDDDRDFRETMREVFQRQGFRVVLAGDGEEALHIVRSQTLHLALLDMHMPRLTGLETIHRIKQLKLLLPCILVSAGLDDVLTEQARRAEAFSVLAKPVRFADVTGAVRLAMRETYNWRFSGDNPPAPDHDTPGK